MDLGWKGRVGLVAAASKGLGYGVAQALAREGASVSICSRTEAEIHSAARTLNEETGSEILGTVCDMRDDASIRSWVAETIERFGKIDALLVNAGGPPAGLLRDFSDEQWQSAFELTLLSTVRLVRAVLPHLKRGSSILTVTSSSIKEPIPRLGLSTVMRAGVAGFVKTLADELADEGIRVNNLLPGRIDTDRVAQLDRNVAANLGITPEEARRRSEVEIPLKRLGTIEEYGAAAAFLLSPAAAYITGASLQVDGGKMRSF
ncbi:MAG: SDR family oxidoreductase [Anaerolineaceae bacterium]|nr:SDR family oxidoreductase [Chloroflexota bacterium]MCY4008577.1 SDR family oxidoreductase [Anaerolineaceae bacterium]